MCLGRRDDGDLGVDRRLGGLRPGSTDDSRSDQGQVLPEAADGCDQLEPGQETNQPLNVKGRMAL